MRIPVISKTDISIFQDLIEHAAKVKECGWSFQQAMDCYISTKCESFETYRMEITTIESEADSIKRRIRGHIPRGTKLPVSAFQLFNYLREQDKVIDSVEDTLNWISYRLDAQLSEQLKKDLMDLLESVIEPIEELHRMVTEATKYFETYSDKQRERVKEIIHNLRQQEHDADMCEHALKRNLFKSEKDPIALYHSIKLADFMGSIADHAENAGDMMRAMIARKR